MAGIWNCKKSVAKTLLMHYMWDKDKLMSECAPDPGLAVQLLQGAHSKAQHAERHQLSCSSLCSFGGQRAQGSTCADARPGLLRCATGDFADHGPEWVYKGAGIAMPTDGDAGPGVCAGQGRSARAGMQTRRPQRRAGPAKRDVLVLCMGEASGRN